jgi:hypothetical protein
MPPRREVAPDDHTALRSAVDAERQARESWEQSRDALEDAIRIAVANGASLRAVADLVGLSHGRVRDIVNRMPVPGDDYYKIVNGEH